jgi:hypothetical protein
LRAWISGRAELERALTFLARRDEITLGQRDPALAEQREDHPILIAELNREIVQLIGEASSLGVITVALCGIG